MTFLNKKTGGVFESLPASLSFPPFLSSSSCTTLPGTNILFLSLLPRFNARFWDPLAENIDAMAQPWQGENNYVNPPWVLLPDIMDKIILEKAWVTLVAPVWPSQPWFQKLKTILVDTPVFLPRDRRTLCYMGPNPEPLRNFGWKVAIWRVYGGHI